MRREYLRLFTTASRCREGLFTPRERSTLDALGVWAVTRAAAHTDDSFAFNKVCVRVYACGGM